MEKPMTFSEFETWMDQNGRTYTKSNLDEYKEIARYLPDHSFGLPGCRQHSYLAMNLFLTAVNPMSLLEIGFNLGHSSMFWLRNGVDQVTSIEIRKDEYVEQAAEVVGKTSEKAGGTFELIYTDSANILDVLQPGSFDAAFIDGSHDYADVLKDIENCLALGIEWLFFDDWLSIYGDVQKAIHDSNLKVHWVSGNMALCTKADNYVRD